MSARPVAALVVPLLASLAASAQPVATPPLPQTVVVSATRHAMAMVDAPAAIEVIDAEQIHARGADNVFEAVRGQTGISIQGRTISGRKAINLRGMDSRHTLVLVDGKRIGASDGLIGHSDYQYDWIAVEDIERIEVVRGPMSVLYGAEALGGVVNIITREPGQRWRFGARLEGSAADGERGGNAQKASLHADGPLGASLRLGLSAATSHRQTVASAADARLSEIEGRDKQDVAARLLWTPAAGQRIEAEHRAGEEERSFLSRERGGKRRYYTSVTPIDRTHSALAWSADWGGAREVRSLLRAYESVIDVGNQRDNGVASLRAQRLEDRVLEGQVSLVPAARQLATTGFEWRDESLDNQGLAVGHATVAHRSLYAQDEVELGRSLSLTAGLRYDRHQRFGHEWSPRAYLVWRVAPGWTVKGGYGHGFKPPTLKQVTPGYVEDEGPFTYYSNPALKPETNDAVEIGVGWDGVRAAAQAMLFRNQVDDLIITRLFDAAKGFYVFENVDRARLQGLEASGTLKVGAGWSASGSYQYLDARDGLEQRLEKQPRHTLGLRVEWAAGPWRAGLRGERHVGQLLASTVAGQPPQPVPGVTMLSAWAGADLGHGLDLGFGVDNLDNVSLARVSPLFTYAEAPRTWRLSLRGRW